ncbi:hypothetical protein DFH09DRAFT_1208468 [Mycena vulgaris]|nr:hypothetical protein DFH09DRAFT_1208468 [Mycena vulgaris]
MAAAQAKDDATLQDALITLDSVSSASSAVRVELDRLTRELHATSKERDSFREQLATTKSELKHCLQMRALDRTARIALEAECGSFEAREAKIRAAEEELRKDRESLSADLKRTAQAMHDTAERHSRRVSAPASPDTLGGTLRKPWLISMSSLDEERPLKRVRQDLAGSSTSTLSSNSVGMSRLAPAKEFFPRGV